MEIKRPLVRYHGGKWKLADWIIGHMPRHRFYVEPFGGGGSVLLKKPRSYAEVYNDLDSEMVNLFTVVRDRGAELIQAVELTPYSREEFDRSYEPSEDPLEQARRTVTRSFQGFGSVAACGAKTGFRSNSNRSGTTPAHDWRNYPSCITSIIDRLRGVVLENKDAVEVMRQHDTEETLHYVDPPYVWSTRSTGNPYCKKGYKYELSDNDHVKLADELKSLKGRVLLSGYDCDLYRSLYPNWFIIHKKTHADGALDRTEVLWLSPNCPPPMSLFRETAA